MGAQTIAYMRKQNKCIPHVQVLLQQRGNRCINKETRSIQYDEEDRMSYQKSVEELFEERFQNLMYVREHDVNILRKLVGDSFPHVSKPRLFCAFDEYGCPRCISDSYRGARDHANMHGILVRLH